jgi:hypothetical protein
VTRELARLGWTIIPAAERGQVGVNWHA